MVMGHFFLQNISVLKTRKALKKFWPFLKCFIKDSQLLSGAGIFPDLRCTPQFWKNIPFRRQTLPPNSKGR